MSRLAAFAAVIVAAVGLSTTTAGASLPPPDESTTTAAVAPTTTAEVAPATTAAASSATTAPAAQRGSAGTVDITKDEDEAWSVRRIATTVGIAVVVLAVLGYVYGRVRSHHRPASSALATTSD
jgi:hypothetical protein